MDWDDVYSDAPRISMANFLYQNIRHGRFRTFKTLLDRGVNINAKNDFGENVLMAALRILDNKKRNKIFTFLLKRDADIHFKDKHYGRNVLLWICVLRREKELYVLLRDAGDELNINEKDNEGYTPLHYATKTNSPNMVLALVKQCSRYRQSVDIQDEQGFTPYILARRLGHRDIASILQDEGNASPAQSDFKRYKSCREWSSYGRWERHIDNRKQQRNQLIMDKINGDYKCGKLEVSRSLDDSSGDGKNHHLPNIQNKLGSLISRDSLNPQDEVDTSKHIRRSSVLAMSLLDMTAPDRGHLVRSFRHSEFDTSKSSEYKDVFGDLTAILDALSQQNSSSFRKTAIEPPRPIKVIDSISEKPKVSSLAIIMGKQRYRSRFKRKGNASEKKNVRINSEKKSKLKPVSSLPQIQINNKVI